MLKKTSAFDLKEEKKITQGWDFLQFYFVSVKILHLTAKLVKEPKNAKKMWDNNFN